MQAATSHIFFYGMTSRGLENTSCYDSEGFGGEHCRVSVWQEFYADYFAIDPFHFTLDLHANHVSMLPTVADPHNSQQACDRMLDAIAAVFLSLKKRPVIRYERSSEIARRVAQDAAVSNKS